jgi:hypothetical protein
MFYTHSFKLRHLPMSSWVQIRQVSWRKNLWQGAVISLHVKLSTYEEVAKGTQGVQQSQTLPVVGCQFLLTRRKALLLNSIGCKKPSSSSWYKAQTMTYLLASVRNTNLPFRHRIASTATSVQRLFSFSKAYSSGILGQYGGRCTKINLYNVRPGGFIVTLWSYFYKIIGKLISFFPSSGVQFV